MRAEELPERGNEVPRRQAVQVQQRSTSLIRGSARPRRQDRRAEPLPPAAGRVVRWSLTRGAVTSTAPAL